jgi:hypothetical protein
MGDVFSSVCTFSVPLHHFCLMFFDLRFHLILCPVSVILSERLDIKLCPLKIFLNLLIKAAAYERNLK